MFKNIFKNIKEIKNNEVNYKVNFLSKPTDNIASDCVSLSVADVIVD